MTDAGWTREPKREGVYWFRWDKDRDAIIVVVLMEYGDWRVMEMGHQYSGALTGYRSGQFLGPLSPTDRQQGRVEAFKEASRKLDNLRDRYMTSNETDLNDFERWLAQAAQDE